jgi:hypothetical protein
MAVQADDSTPLPNPTEPAGAVCAMHLFDFAQSRGGLDHTFSPQAEWQGHAGANVESERKGTRNCNRKNQLGHFSAPCSFACGRTK